MSEKTRLKAEIYDLRRTISHLERELADALKRVQAVPTPISDEVLGRQIREEIERGPTVFKRYVDIPSPDKAWLEAVDPMNVQDWLSAVGPDPIAKPVADRLGPSMGSISVVGDQGDMSWNLKPSIQRPTDEWKAQEQREAAANWEAEARRRNQTIPVREEAGLYVADGLHYYTNEAAKGARLKIR